MKIQNIFFLFFLIVLVACKNDPQYKNAQSIHWNDFGEEKLLNGEELYFDDKLQKPLHMLATDSLIYLANISSEYLLQIVNPLTEQSLGDFISFGSGPDEFIGIKKIIEKDSILYLYDFTQMSLRSFRFSENKLLQHGRSTNYKFPFFDLLITSDTSTIALAVDTHNKRISFFNKDSLIGTTGEYPEIQNVNLDPLEQMEGFAGSLVGNSEHNSLVLVHKQTDLIEFFDMDGNFKKRLHGPDHFFPLVKSHDVGGGQTRVRSKSGESRDAYFNPVADKDFFYVLYSGKIFDRENVDYLSEWILVFDWDGNPVARYKLDKPIFAFSVDTKNRIMYGISDRPEFHIVKYNF